MSTEEENHVNRNLIRREAKVVKKFGPKIEKNASTQVKKDNYEQSGRNLRKTGANQSSTAVSNPSELSGRSFNNERCPEVETFCSHQTNNLHPILYFCRHFPFKTNRIDQNCACKYNCFISSFN